MNRQKLKFSFLMIAALLVTSCNSHDQPEDILRTVHGDSNVYAIVTRSGEGATTDFAYHVYVGKSKKFNKKNEILLADNLKGLDLFWDNSHLTIKMDCGRVFRYRNFFDILDESGQLSKEISINLAVPGPCANNIIK
ncbi:MAG: hypothetical protein ACYC0F_01370 [Rhodanobacter sp.]